MTYALTYPQLMNQGIARGLRKEELDRLRHAYNVAERLTAGFYRGQGVPFICHLVRTASIVLAQRQPVEVVIASIVHAAYLLPRPTEELGGRLDPRRREWLRRQIGADAETLVWEYDRTPWYSAKALDGHLRELERYSPTKRQVIVIQLANALEDHLDLGMAYRGSYPVRERIKAFGRQKIQLARRLGCDQLAAELEAQFHMHLAETLPTNLKQHRRGTYLRWHGPGALIRSLTNVAKRVKRALLARHDPRVFSKTCRFASGHIVSHQLSLASQVNRKLKKVFGSTREHE